MTVIYQKTLSDAFSLMRITSNHVGGSFNLFMATTGYVRIILSFRIWDYVLHVEHISCVITYCDQHRWAFSFLNSSFGLALGKYYQKISIPIFRFILQNFTFPGCFNFLKLFSIAKFLLTFFWLGCYCSMWLCSRTLYASDDCRILKKHVKQNRLKKSTFFVLFKQCLFIPKHIWLDFHCMDWKINA